MSIPKSITRAELNEALSPLCQLLGTSPKNFYDSPGLTISNEHITLVVPVRHEEDPTGRAEGERGDFPHPQGEEYLAELAYAVTIKIELG